MRVAILLLLVAFCYAAPNRNVENPSPRYVSAVMKELFEVFRKMLKEGNSLVGLPVMDPFQMDNVAFNLDSKLLSFELESANNLLVGLSDFEVHNFEFSLDPLGIKYDFTMPYTVQKSDAYDFDGLVFTALPIYGKGKSHFELTNLNIDGFSNIAVGPQGVFIKDMNLKIKVGQLKSETTGMIGGGDIDNVINAILADLAPDFFNANSEILSDAISNVSIAVFNKFLEGLSLLDLIDMIVPKN